MHGDQIVRAQELVQFHVMHVTSGPDLRGMQHGEDMVVVHVDLGHVVAFQAVPDRDVVEPERLRQHHRGPPSHRGMSTQTSTSGRPSRPLRSSAGHGFTPNSLTRYTSTIGTPLPRSCWWPGPVPCRGPLMWPACPPNM